MTKPIELRHGKHDIQVALCSKCRTRYLINATSKKYHEQCKPYWVMKSKKRYITKK